MALETAGGDERVSVDPELGVLGQPRMLDGLGTKNLSDPVQRLAVCSQRTSQSPIL